MSQAANSALVELEHVTKHFPVKHGVFSRARGRVHAVEDVNLTVYRGETIEQSDLAAITVRGDSLPHAIPAAQLGDLVGKRAAFDLIEGSIIPSTAIVEQAIPAEGRAIVGLKLAPGRAPGNLLLPSSAVRLIALPTAADGSTADKLVGSIFVGRVIDQFPAADGTSIMVNVDVDAGAAPTIAMLAAQDRIAIVRDAGR